MDSKKRGHGGCRQSGRRRNYNKQDVTVAVVHQQNEAIAPKANRDEKVPGVSLAKISYTSTFRGMGHNPEFVRKMPII